MNLTLTMQFDNLDQLQSFLNRNPSAASTPVAFATPENVVAMPTPAAAPAVAAPAPAVAAPAPAVAPAVAPAPAADRQTLMNRLRELAGAMDDPGVLGQFINGFGVARFSDLPDDQLTAFSAALAAEFGQ